MTTRLYLVRHGATHLTTEDRFSGSIGVDLSDEGRAQARRLAEDLVAPPGAEDPKWQAIAEELRRILREGKFGSWFGRVGFHGIADGVLQLSTPSGVAADRIRGEFIPAIKAAAEAADLFVERVVITLRKDQR